MLLLLLVLVATIIMSKLFVEYMLKGDKKIAKILYSIIILINIILVISVIKDYNSNKFGFVACIKLSCLFMNIFIVLFAPIAAAIRSNKVNRILAAFDGRLGDNLRARLPIDAIVYTADTHAITWHSQNGDSRIIAYSSLGFGKLPNNYEFVVCQWIRDNIVYDKTKYHFEAMTYESDHYEASDKVTVKKEYTNSYVITREPGKYVTANITIGHALVHNGYDFEGHRVNTTPLKKW